MCIRLTVFVSTLLAVRAFAQVSPISITLEGTTPTQAVFSYDAPDAASCTITVAEKAASAVPVHDVDPALFPGADQDLARPSTVVSGTRRSVTIGARTSELAKDQKLYSRALQAATVHTFSVTCTRSAGELDFTTENPPLGNTYPETPPFNAAGFGNYAWPQVDWSDRAKTYVDPITGLLLKPAIGADPHGATGQWGADKAEWPFHDAFDLNNAWNNAVNISAGSTDGPFATYAGSGGDALFLPFSPFPATETTIAGWDPTAAVWDDVRLTLYGYGSDAGPENRKVLACLAAMFVPAANKCTGPEIELTLPSGSAGTVTSPGFPKFYFGAWNPGRFLTREEASTPYGTAAVSDSVVTWKSGVPFPLTMPAGVKINLGGKWYTVAGIDHARQLTLAEPSVTVSGDVPYYFGAFGIRIRKKTGTGSINVNASWTLAWSHEQDMPYNGVADMCSSLSFPVDYQADGITPVDPPEQGRLCLLGRVNTRLVLLIPATGETRVLSGLDHQDAGSYTLPVVPLGAFSSTDPLTIYGFHGDDAVQMHNPSALYRITYDPSVCHFRAWPGNNYTFPGGPAAADCLTWTNLTPASEGRDVITQFQKLASQNRFWDPPVMSAATPVFAGITSKYAVFRQYFGGPQNTPCFVGVFDLDSGNIIQVTDSFGGSTPTMRWGGCHTAPDRMFGKWISLVLIDMGAVNGPGYLGGPFQVRSLDSLSKDGGAAWSTDTSLTNLDAATCTTTDAGMIAKGAAGQKCIKLRISSDYPCSLVPANGDAARFPCPWNPQLAGPMTLAVGDYISDLRNWPTDGINGKDEKMLITSKTDLGNGEWELELMRWAACDDYVYYSHILAPGGSIHANGWVPYMTGTDMCTGVNAWFDATDTSHTFYTDSSTVTDGHGTLGPAPHGMFATLVDGGASRLGPFPGQFNLPPNFVQNLLTTTFAGVTRNSGTDVESYPNLGQWTATDSEKAFAFDLRHLNPGLGLGPEYPSSVWRQHYTRVPGLKQVYQIDNFGGVFGKVFPYLAFAGANLLKDMSGPKALIGDQDEWRFCVAYRAGECRPGSSASDVFVNVPRATVTDSCVVNTYAYNSPCFTTPYVYGGWAVQYQYTQDDPKGQHFRRLTMGFTGPGRQYQFTNIHVTPEGRWAFLAPGWVDGSRAGLMMVKLPPAPVDDHVDRSTFAFHQVDISADGVSVAARVRFGYAENGPVSSFFCTSRQEACLTDATISPFAYETSDTPVPAPCAAGCTIYVPSLPDRVQYYRVERLTSNNEVTTGPTQVYVGNLTRSHRPLPVRMLHYVK